MLKWFLNLCHGAYHALTQPTTGEYLTVIVGRVDKDLKAAQEKAAAAWSKDMAAVEAVAHKELNALQATVEHAQVRIQELLHAGVDLGERNVEAALLHLNLTKAVK